MPTRMIREGFLDSELLQAAGEPAEVLFFRILLVIDDYARFDARTDRLDRACWPAGKAPSAEDDLAARLARLNDLELILTYEAQGKPYLVVPKFGQRMRAKHSKFPQPPPTVLARLSQLENGAPSKVAERKKPAQSTPAPPTRRAHVRHMSGTRPTHDRHMTAESEAESKSKEINTTVTNRGSSTELSTTPRNDGHMTGISPANGNGVDHDPPPTPFEDLPDIEPPPDPTPAKAPPADEDDDNPELDSQAKHLGMQRLQFETDDELRVRLQARRALG